jgi:acetylglutamate kinase
VKVLVKLGGTLLDSPDTRHRLAAEIAAVQRAGTEVVVVHGGGKQMTRFLVERGVESRFVGGLRVTTPEILDAVLKIFAGSVNHELVAAFVQAGALPVGLSGIDACLVEAEPLNPDLGAVGRPVRSNPELLRILTAAGYLPVVACVAGDRAGNVYNVNADQMAVSCAAGLPVDKLLFLTDVEGVKDKNGNVIARLSSAQAGRLIAEGVATGGMQAKLNAAIDALRLGVQEVFIAPGALAGVTARLLAGEPLGSRMVAEGEIHG